MSKHNWRDHWQVWLLDSTLKPQHRLDHLTGFCLDWKLRDLCSFTANLPVSSEQYDLINTESDQFLYVRRVDDPNDLDGSYREQMFAIQSQTQKWRPVGGRLTKTVELAGLGGAALWLSKRIIQPDPSGTIETWSVDDHVDDAIKDLIIYNCVSGTAYADPNGDPRGITGLTVGADKHEHPTELSQAFSGNLWDTVKNLCLTYDVDLTCTPAWNGKDAAVTVTLDTFYQGRGSDRTPGEANPVILSDRYGVLADSSWSYNLFPWRSHAYARTGHNVVARTNAGDHLRAEVITTGYAVSALEQALAEHKAERGHEFTFMETDGVMLGRDFWLGDTMAHHDTELETGVKEELLAAVKITIANDALGSETVELTFGDEKPTSDSGGGGGYSPIPGVPDADCYWARSGDGTVGYTLYPNSALGAVVAVALYGGTDLKMYSNAGSTLKFDVDGATGYITSASNALLAGEYVYLGDVNTYVRRNASGGAMVLYTDQAEIYFRPDSTTIARLSAAAFFPHTTNTVDLGGTSNAWANVYATNAYANKFYDKVATAYYFDGNADPSIVIAGDINMADTKTVDGVDVSEHTHHYDKPTETGGYTVYGATDYDSNWLRVTSSPTNKVYLGTAYYRTSPTAGYELVSVGSTQHSHDNADSAWNYTETDTSAPA